MAKLLQFLGVPEWAAWLALLVASGVLLAIAVASYGHQRFEDGQASVQQRWDAEKLASSKTIIRAQAEVATVERTQAAKAEKVDTHVQTQLAAVAADRDRAVRAAAGLRDELASVRADAMSGTATSARLAAQVATLADVLGECGERRAEVARQADELAVQVGGLLALLPPMQP